MQGVYQGNKKIKILFVITKSVWAGAGKYVYDLAINLPKEKFDVCVAAGGQNKLAQEIKKSDVNYYEIKNFQRDIGIIKEILSFFEVFKLINNFKPDIIHASSSKAGGIAGIAVKICNLPRPSEGRGKTIFTVHGWAFNEARPNWQIYLIKFFSRLTCLFCDKIISVSEFDRRAAIKNKIAATKKLITIRNGISADEYQFLSKEEAMEKLKTKNEKLKTATKNLKDENAVFVGTIGEFTKNKGQKYLIDAVVKLRTTNYELRTIIIGWGEDKKNLEYRIRNLGLEDKVFLIEGLAPAAPYLKAFDIFILPSIKEGLPYTLLESGLAEIPIIATNVGGNPEIIENKKTGLLINPSDPDEIANAIKNLINNPELAKKLTSNLRQKILQDFSLKKMIQETSEVYSKVYKN